MLTLPDDHLGLYIHVPFCVRKCRYCDFASQPLAGQAALVDQYLEALICEAARVRAACPRPVHSIFIGGGTPTVLTGPQLARLWREVVAPFPRVPQAEITLEANPGTLTPEVLAVLRDLPLTRISLGVQSFHADELALLGRIHTAEAVYASVAAVRQAGIPQLNLDLMYALPGQTAARWRESLRQALALRPEHLSLYALILEDGTPLAAQVAAGLCPAPDEEEEEEMTADTTALLAEGGLSLYEVSNAARPGTASRHNLGYWLGRDYLGLGPAATSALGAVRWRNTTDVAEYAARALAGRPVTAYLERLSAPARLLERVMLGLRLRAGFNLADAETDCGCMLTALAGDAERQLQEEGLLARDGAILRLTPAGYPLANAVVTRLMTAAEGR